MHKKAPVTKQALAIRNHNTHYALRIAAARGVPRESPIFGNMQDSMATTGNFGGGNAGAAGPDQGLGPSGIAHNDNEGATKWKRK
jgi:hypothetical protein